MTKEEIKEELLFIPKGWVKAFGDKMVDELIDMLKEYDVLDDYIVMQSKEKWGALEWYDWGIPEEIADRHHAWKCKYRQLSKITCAVCGEQNVALHKEYMLPLCTKCELELRRR